MKTTIILLSVFLGVFFLGTVGLGLMWNTANDDLKTAESQLATKTSELSDVQSDLSTANTTINDLESQITNLEQENNTLQDSLDEIGEVFPARYFSSLDELLDWLQGNNLSERPPSVYADDWYSNGLLLQEDALNDGYIISVDYDYFPDEEAYIVSCVTIINGYIYWWDPETDDVFQEPDFGPVR